MANAIEIAKAHPFWVIGGVIGGVLIIQFMSKGKSSAATSAPATFAYAADPITTQAQLQRDLAQTASATAIQQASLAAQVATDANHLQAGISNKQIDNATAIQMASMATNQNLALASMQAQHAANAQSMITNAFNSMTKVINDVSKSGTETPTTEAIPFGTRTTTPANLINVPLIALEQMFNNVIRSTQGTGPLETAIIQEPPTVRNNVVIPSDPIFVNWVAGQNLPTVTDITPNPTPGTAAWNALFGRGNTNVSTAGWQGSFIDPSNNTKIIVH